MRRLIVILSAALAFAACSVTKTPESGVITPVPNSIEYGKGAFNGSKTHNLYTNLGPESSADFLAHLAGFGWEFGQAGLPADAAVHLLLEQASADFISPEAYTLEITPGSIVIKASGEAGLFYGVQSLLQLREFHGNKIPCQTIADSPRFGYRGHLLDVSRHFRGVDYVKKQLDMMAYFKLNRLHWHLTDAAGWRLEIDRYPLLTQVAAWRPYEDWFGWDEGGRKYCESTDPKAQGGFFTKEQVRDILDYAAKLHITVIPEIEMPGHSAEVLAVYPELSCSGEPYVDEDFCIGNEETFTFLENVLTEVMELFPSEYIHIGGDEATKRSWKECPKCQARMRKEELKDVDELQSYMIRRIEKFLMSNGRRLIGWDEIIQGGLAPEATVMSWRGVSGGMEAIAAGRQAIMTPDAYCYLDHYQDAPYSQPLAMASYLPIEKVYSYNPIPDTLTAPQVDLVLGVQGNVWAERIPSDEHCEYMTWPRLIAVAEVAWSEQADRSYAEFYERVLRAVDYMKSKGYNPFDLANAIGERKEFEEKVEHLASGKPVEYLAPYYPGKYSAGGDGALVDGLQGSWGYADGRWQGILNRDLDVIIDLERPTKISSIEATFMQERGAGIWLPSEIEITVSDDGVEYRPLAVLTHDTPREEKRVKIELFKWEGEQTARYIHYKAVNGGRRGSFMFTDEIIVR